MSDVVIWAGDAAVERDGTWIWLEDDGFLKKLSETGTRYGAFDLITMGKVDAVEFGS